jgi:hypothetical protein
MVSRVPTAKMRLEGLMAFIEAVVQNHKRNPCDKQDYNEQEMREYKALRLGQTIHTSYELDAAWKAMIEAAIAE